MTDRDIVLQILIANSHMLIVSTETGIEVIVSHRLSSTGGRLSVT